MSNIENRVNQLFKELDITNLKEDSKRTNILLQQLLQKLMLNYTVDISQQVMLKQEDVSSNYPSDMISSLKVIADLYFKMKDENKLLTITEEQSNHNSNRVF